MLSPDEILQQAATRFTQHLEITRTKWRPQEVNENYSVVEGEQWLSEDYDRQRKDEMPIITINEISPGIDAIAGFEIQNRSEASFTPRLNDNDSKGFTDLVDVGVKYIEHDSKAAFENSQAFKDMLVCGVGATDTRISYDNNVNGQVEVERIFPGFLLWDPAARKKNLKDANWVAVARIVDRKVLEDEEGQGEDTLQYSPIGTSFDESEFLNYFDSTMHTMALTVVYDYQWRVKEPIIRIKNPFYDHLDSEMEDLIMNYAADAAKRFKFDLGDGILVFDKKKFSQFKKECDSLGIELTKQTAQKRYRYYRCQIKNNRVYDPEENFSQEGFSLKFMTGKFSETDQCWYGVVRGAKPGQRLLNQAISDYQGFLRTIPKGGVNIEVDAVPNIKSFIRTYPKSKSVTVYNSGALANGKVQPKLTPPMPPGLIEMVQVGGDTIMKCMGITPSLMGDMQSREMTGKLQGQLVRQALTTLADYFDAKKYYTIDQGRMFIDCLRILAENDPGRLIRNITGKGSEQYIPLLLDNIAAEYDVEITDVPQTPTERQDTFEKLLEMSGVLLNKPNPTDITPLMLQYAPLKKDELDQIQQAMQPPPPPPPDPLQQGLLQAEIAMRGASAEKSKAEAMKINMDALLKQKELETQQGADKSKVEEAYAKAAVDDKKNVADHIIQKEQMVLDYQKEMDKLELQKEIAQSELELKKQVEYANIAVKIMEIKAQQQEAPEEDADSEDKMTEMMAPMMQALEDMQETFSKMTLPRAVTLTRGANGELKGGEITIRGD